jgi:hypothetical protein
MHSTTTNKPKIIHIKLTPEQLQEIEQLNKGITVPATKTVRKKDGRTYEITTKKRFTLLMRRERLKKIYGGNCMCDQYCTVKVIYDVGDEKQKATLLQKYCDSCFEKSGIGK